MFRVVDNWCSSIVEDSIKAVFLLDLVEISMKTFGLQAWWFTVQMLPSMSGGHV